MRTNSAKLHVMQACHIYWIMRCPVRINTGSHCCLLGNKSFENEFCWSELFDQYPLKFDCIGAHQPPMYERYSVSKLDKPLDPQRDCCPNIY